MNRNRNKRSAIYVDKDEILKKRAAVYIEEDGRRSKRSGIYIDMGDTDEERTPLLKQQEEIAQKVQEAYATMDGQRQHLIDGAENLDDLTSQFKKVEKKKPLWKRYCCCCCSIES